VSLAILETKFSELGLKTKRFKTELLKFRRIRHSGIKKHFSTFGKKLDWNWWFGLKPKGKGDFPGEVRPTGNWISHWEGTFKTHWVPRISTRSNRSLSDTYLSGRVFKGKKLPGRMGQVKNVPYLILKLSRFYLTQVDTRWLVKQVQVPREPNQGICLP